MAVAYSVEGNLDASLDQISEVAEKDPEIM